jgi:hypothetical protein
MSAITRIRNRGPTMPASPTPGPVTHQVRLDSPRVEGNEVLFAWQVTPATELYRRTSFRLSFPPDLELTTVPDALWWRIGMLCLHTHWALLRPCRVELPISLDDPERQFWMRLIENARIQIEAYGGTASRGPAVQLIDRGPAVGPVRLAATDSRPAVAFSGGKDSLVLTALLVDLGERPLLVSITSPVVWARDHRGASRERARAEVERRLGLDSVEVASDFRTAWRFDFSADQGCRLGVHELSDLCLYHGAIAAVAAATGIGRIFMASEADLQYNASAGGHTVLHPEFLSCAVMQSALDALLRRFGVRQEGSLTHPLHMHQVQALLLHRYRHLADLQCSCWRAPPGAQACSACEKCFQVALVALAEGFAPRLVGLDLVRILRMFGDWRLAPPAPRAGIRLHHIHSARNDIIRILQTVPTTTVRSVLADDSGAYDDSELSEAAAVYARLRAQAFTFAVPPAPGYIGEFLSAVDAGMREPLRAILDEHFAPAPRSEFQAIVHRSRSLSNRITGPLTAGDRLDWAGRAPGDAQRRHRSRA